MEKRQIDLDIKTTRDAIGWAYSGLKWLTEEEAKLANKERNELLKSLSGRVDYSFMKNKLHSGALSPGCLICGQGLWSCLFINVLCTARCFYCPQDRTVKKEEPPLELISFDNPRDYADYLERLKCTGVSFSGGEPLLVFDKLLVFIEKLRKRFARTLYLWCYTNGDLVNEDKLGRLKKAGLDEIRFDISARNYDLRPVELATRFIDTVTVEVPSIPENHEILKGCLKKMQEIGVKHLNLHQLIATEYNYKKFIARGYTFLHHLNIPVLESEISALKLLKYALDNNIKLPINYCSGVYKARLQGKGLRERLARLVKKDHEELTGSGYIRDIVICDSTTNLKEIISIFKKHKCENNLWSLNDTGTELSINRPLLKHLDAAQCKFIVRYFEVRHKKPLSGLDETGGKITLNPKRAFFLQRACVKELKNLSFIAMTIFQKLFIENMGKKAVMGYFVENYDIKTREGLNKLGQLVESFKPLKHLENVEKDFQEIY